MKLLSPNLEEAPPQLAFFAPAKSQTEIENHLERLDECEVRGWF